MKYRLWIAGIALLVMSCNEAPGIRPGTEDNSIWSSPPACMLYGLVFGIMTGWILFRTKKNKAVKSGNGKPIGPEAAEAQRTAKLSERELLRTEKALSVCRSECMELQRKVDELERLIEPKAGTILPADEMVTEKLSVVSEVNALYFLQPTTEGHFTEAGAVAREADAVYELHLSPGNIEEATLRFIDTPGNAVLAIQNEASWILVACERSNIATASTRSIRTDIPGLAVKKNGVWVIVQKAKISYQ